MWIAIAAALYLLGMMMYDCFITGNGEDFRRRDLNLPGKISYLFWPFVALFVVITVPYEWFKQRRKPDHFSGSIIPGPQLETEDEHG